MAEQDVEIVRAAFEAFNRDWGNRGKGSPTREADRAAFLRDGKITRIVTLPSEREARRVLSAE